jgi:hypothetical protein|tara:strand:- start:309 stop:554 length:246 start_codon:yes stop_codon:yes gene_type:complete
VKLLLVEAVVEANIMTMVWMVLMVGEKQVGMEVTLEVVLTLAILAMVLLMLEIMVVLALVIVLALQEEAEVQLGVVILLEV